jgi:hypothetical protein
VPERVDELFDEYAAAYVRGERPAASEFLARAGGEADELAGLIDAFLARAPAPAPDETTVALFEAWQAGESPLLRLRTARGLKRETVVATIVRALGLNSQKEAKVSRYYHELESGVLDPNRVDRRLWDVLANALGARVGDLAAWRPRPMEFQAPAFARTSMTMSSIDAPTAPDTAAESQDDEIDRLFNASGLP